VVSSGGYLFRLSQERPLSGIEPSQDDRRAELDPSRGGPQRGMRLEKKIFSNGS